MELNIIDKQYLDTEDKYLDLNQEVAEYIISEYRSLSTYYNFNGKPLDVLLSNYFYLKSKNEHHILEEVLNKYCFNYTSSIHNAIYDLLLVNEDRALLWPGVNKIEKCNELYKLNTKNGLIKVSKASRVFKDHKSSYIFKKELRGNCFARTLDFLIENKDYKAVLSYDNNLFVGGHYHAYLENNNQTLDIASNALYETDDDRKKVLDGKIIKKLTLEEVIDSFNKVLEEVPTLDKNDDKLQVLALYYGKKKKIK